MIYPDIFPWNPLSSLYFLRHQIDAFPMNLEDNGSPSQLDLREMVGRGPVVRIGQFYERDHACFEWYYSVYGLQQDMADDLPVNSAASIIRRDGTSLIRGAVVVVKDGPRDGAWERSLVISEDSIARCIWWYHRSGTSVADIIGERGMLRWLSLPDAGQDLCG